MSFFRILHLSDIHIGNTYISSREIAYKISQDIIENDFLPIRGVIVTGDIFNGRSKVTNQLIEEAANFFGIILDQINKKQCTHKINLEDFIFVPGNHDLIRVENVEERWSKYNNFLSKFYNDNIPSIYILPDYSVFKQYDDSKLVFIGFNSCQIEKKKLFNEQYLEVLNKNIEPEKLEKIGINKRDLIELLKKETKEEYDDYGEISIEQITKIKDRVKELDGYNVVALFHHHFYLFPEVAKEYGDSSLVRNYTDLIQQLKYMNVKTVLHGHKHFDLERPFITDDYYENAGCIIDVFSGGSVGVGGKEKHTFSIIDFYQESDDIKLVQNKFVYNGTRLDPIIKKQIPPKSNTRKVVKILELLRSKNYNVYQQFDGTVENLFKIDQSCRKIISWIDKAIMEFDEVYRHLEDDILNIIFLLFGIYYRVSCYKELIEKDQYYSDSTESLKNMLEKFLVGNELDIDMNGFYSIFQLKNLTQLTQKCDSLLNGCDDSKIRKYIAFSLVGIFFSDLYMVLTEYADDFYKTRIKYKVNIKIEENKFHENVPSTRIVITSDFDRRHVCIELLCKEATAHKLAVLFIKEFDLFINKFEEYFKLIGLKMYYLVPKITKNESNNTLDNYNFEAYIPTLLPLLTGDNIYSAKEVFARELIQNSIDAISVREEKTKSKFDKSIWININQDENNRLYFQIKDYGTGMDRYKIERYFTSIGRSFYSGDEYEDLKISYKPISNFGIGFLSSFMVCKEIDVKTTYFVPESETLKLHIPNYDGCFFIEHAEKDVIGTDIKLFLNKEVDTQKLIKYIKNVMLDIKYDIYITQKVGDNLEKTTIPAYSIRSLRKDNHCIFFVPFEENIDIGNIDWESEILSNKFIKKYDYGLFIRPKVKKIKGAQTVLNAGILVEQAAPLEEIFSKKVNEILRGSYYNCHSSASIVYNFPANWIQIDVSREKLTGFSPKIDKKLIIQANTIFTKLL